MPDKERQAFEEKLSADESFRRSFKHYRAHREELLEDLLEEDETEARRRWGLNSWLYLLISLTGIALAVHYYAFKTPEPHKAAAPKKNFSWNIFKRIPFLDQKNELPKTEPAHTAALPTDSLAAGQPAGDTSYMAVSEEALVAPRGEDFGIASDIMEFDTFMVAFEKNYYELRYRVIRSETDSMITDSLLQMLAAKSVGRNAQLAKPVTVYVEFWRSPVNFRGYKFNGKKLVIYGVPAPYEIYLLQDADGFVLRTTRHEFTLIQDNSFHKF